MSVIIVTGGCGYIGSHTIVDLIENGYDVVSFDSLIRSEESVINGINKITGKTIINEQVDLCNETEVKKAFDKYDNISGVIHFAAFKTVPESIKNPILYYQNNITSLLNVLKQVQNRNIKYFVFSSSCSVYGNPSKLPVTEKTEIKKAECPYAHTKQIGEEMCLEISKLKNIKTVMLRYFNPAGAHPSINIGEKPYNTSDNLVPIIAQTAIGKIKQMNVFGNDYNTKDGSCIRDYIHVMDIAHAHTLAINHMSKMSNKNVEIFNLGSEVGKTVLEVIEAFERVNEIKLNYKIVNRRPGDVESIYANCNMAKKALGWETKFNLDNIVKTAWEWEKAMNAKQNV